MTKSRAAGSASHEMIAEILHQDADDISRWAFSIPSEDLPEIVKSLSATIADSDSELLIRIKAARAMKALPPHGRNPLSTFLWPKESLELAQEAVILTIGQASEDAEFETVCVALLRRIMDLAGKAGRSRLAVRRFPRAAKVKDVRILGMRKLRQR